MISKSPLDSTSVWIRQGYKKPKVFSSRALHTASEIIKVAKFQDFCLMLQWDIHRRIKRWKCLEIVVTPKILPKTSPEDA